MLTQSEMYRAVYVGPRHVRVEVRELSNRWWCPRCRIERTGDRLDRPCCCMKKEP